MGTTVRDLTRGERRFAWGHHSLFFESVRRLTFAKWTVTFVDPDDLARDGFFYGGEEDLAHCIFCGHVRCSWEAGDEVREEHLRGSPRCPLLAGLPTGNVPRGTSGDGAGRLFALLEEYHAFRVAEPRLQGSAEFASARPEFPELSSMLKRLQTFKDWPRALEASRHGLAEAGFFYIGLGDCVRCFHCGGGIHSWRTDDDLWRDHARSYPLCDFVRMRMGEEEFADAVKRSPPASGPSRSDKLTTEEAELLLDHPLAQRVVSQGFSPEAVRDALKHQIEGSGLACNSVPQMIQIVWDYIYG